MGKKCAIFVERDVFRQSIRKCRNFLRSDCRRLLRKSLMFTFWKQSALCIFPIKLLSQSQIFIPRWNVYICSGKSEYSCAIEVNARASLFEIERYKDFRISGNPNYKNFKWNLCLFYVTIPHTHTHTRWISIQN